jgi:peroxiredoxin
MADKLNAGSRFPSMRLLLVDGSAVSLPEDLESDYAVVLFYRGHW